MDPHTAILPLITVGITAYNAAGTIEAAVESALAQNWKPKEIIVVNDASSDCTGEILDALASKFPDIRVIHHPENKGVAGAKKQFVHGAKMVITPEAAMDPNPDQLCASAKDGTCTDLA